jgi:hypothetical protein
MYYITFGLRFQTIAVSLKFQCSDPTNLFGYFLSMKHHVFHIYILSLFSKKKKKEKKKQQQQKKHSWFSICHSCISPTRLIIIFSSQFLDRPQKSYCCLYIPVNIPTIAGYKLAFWWLKSLKKTQNDG